MSAAEATHPRWSPDGRTVAFSSTGDLWRLAVRPAGRGLRLTRKCRACLGDDFPAWSPDGRKILFVRDGALFTIRALNGAHRGS
jgi:dipeptidyl aminopeptidase/acylaminoacyl peptidase